jgi:hypothetical protein
MLSWLSTGTDGPRAWTRARRYAGKLPGPPAAFWGLVRPVYLSVLLLSLCFFCFPFILVPPFANIAVSLPSFCYPSIFPLSLFLLLPVYFSSISIPFATRLFSLYLYSFFYPSIFPLSLFLLLFIYFPASIFLFLPTYSPPFPAALLPPQCQAVFKS